MRNRLNWLKRSALSYAVAALVVAAALVANLLLETYLQASPTLFLFLCSIIFATWFGGVGPGLAATAMSILAFDYFFLAPIYSVDLMPRDLPRIALFAIAALFVVGLMAAQKNVAESLLRSQRELQLTIDMIPAKITVYHADGTARQSANLTWCDYTGLSMGDKAAARSWAVTHPDDFKAIEAEWTAHLAKREPFQAEVRLRRRDGVYRWHMVHRVPLRNQAGDVTKWYAVAVDIEDRKQAEDALGERAQLLDLTHDTIFVRSMNDVVSFWNRGAEQLYGWSKEEALGQISHQLLRTIFPSPLEGIASELLSTSHWEGELVHTKRDGTQVTVASRWSLRRDEHGRPVGILETNNDITERKRAEYLAGHVFESSPDAMAIVGRDYRFQRVNPVHERFWKRPAGSMVGKRTAEIMGREFFEQKGKSNLDQCFAGEEISYADWFATPHGRKYRAITLSPLRPGSQQVEAALVIARDFTDYAQASEALREAQMRLAHVNRVATMGQLTASIVHEVRQPITAAVANADAGLRWLAAQPPDLKEIQEALEGVLEAGNQASEVVSRIHGLVKKVPAQKATLNVNEAVLATIALTRMQIQQHGILLKTELANDLPGISADRIQLQQVMLNLIMNAIEAMSETSEEPRELLIRSEISLPDAIMVSVRDSGPGLKPESLNHLFEPFYSTKPAGMGMGLPICRSIIEAHGGRLWAAANTPRGAVFHFTLRQNDES